MRYLLLLYSVLVIWSFGTTFFSDMKKIVIEMLHEPIDGPFWQNIWQVPIAVLMVILFVSLVFVFSPFLWILWHYKKYEEAQEEKKRKLEQEFDDQAHPSRMWMKSEPFKELTICYYTAPSLPFQPNPQQIVYVEDEYNEAINTYIREHFDLINDLFQDKQKPYTFIYLPQEVKSSYEKQSILKYFFPLIEDEAKDKLLALWDKMTTTQFSQIIFTAANIPLTELRPGLLRVKERTSWENSNPKLTFVPFEENTDEYISSFFVNLFMQRGGEAAAYFTQLEGTTPDYADRCFDEEMQKIADDVKQKIEHLKQEGYFELLLNTLGENLLDEIKQSQLNPPLSEIVVTKDFEIVLPGYNNTVIKMSPLPKAVYLLFLRHPGGIRFKELPEYREELFEIYKSISPRESLKKMKESIELVTDPTRNAINEKCSRIREAFLVHFDDHIARNYYVTGERGEVKKVILIGC